MKKAVLIFLALMMLTEVPCLAFDGYQGHEGQTPLCQNNMTGALRFAPMKDIDTSTGVNYEPYCNTAYKYRFGKIIAYPETLVWMNIQGIQGPQGIQGIQGEKGDKGDQGFQGIQGVQGEKGDKGDQGLQGIQGVQGPVGPQGPQAVYEKVAVVAQGGGDYTDPVTAMNDLSTWCGTPSATNPCLLKIMPGVYDIGANPFQMQNYVDIEGSGEKNTTITGGSTDGIHLGVVMGASNAEIRFLTVNQTGGGNEVYSILNNLTSPKITNVTAISSGGAEYTVAIGNHGGSPTMTNVTATATSSASGITGFCMGISNNSSSPVMTNVKATASGSAHYIWGIYNLNSSSPVTNNVTAVASGTTNNTGVFNNGSSPAMTHLTAIAINGVNNLGISNYQSCSPTMFNVVASGSGGTSNYGLYIGNSSGTVKIDHSVMSGSTNAIYNSTGVSLYVANTKLDGGPVFNTGGIKCIGAYDGDYNALNGTCQ